MSRISSIWIASIKCNLEVFLQNLENVFVTYSSIKKNIFLIIPPVNENLKKIAKLIWNYENFKIIFKIINKNYL